MTPARRALLVLTVVAASVGAAPVKERPPGWYAVVETSLGSFTIQLFPEQAPQSVAYFVAFAQGRIEYVDPFTGNKKKTPIYDGVAIHKVTFQTRFEAGDPTGTGHGMPQFFVPREAGPKDFAHPFRVGTTAAALQRNSGVVFFVSMVAEPYLSAGHNCFGEVVEGREVVVGIAGIMDHGFAPAKQGRRTGTLHGAFGSIGLQITVHLAGMYQYLHTNECANLNVSPVAD